MKSEDKLGLGAGALALGLAGGIIFLAQWLPGGAIVLPHRDLYVPEAIFDAIMAIVGIPLGAYWFYQGAFTKK